MSTPTGDDSGNQWALPGDPTRPVPHPAPSGYGTPASPSYGKYGQGVAEPVPAQPGPPGQPPGQPQPQWGQPQPGGPQWGQPGYVSPQQWVPHGGPTVVESVGRMQTWVIGLSVLLGVGMVAAAAFAPNQHQMLVDAVNGELVTAQTGSSASQAARSLTLLVEIVAWVVGCLWITRVRHNAMVLQPHQPRRSEVWIWLGWVIPIVQLWFPKQIIDDVIAATSQATGMPRLRTGWWWAAWLSTWVLGLVLAVATVLPPNDGVHAVLAALYAVATTVAALLWIRIVGTVSAAQDAQVTKPGLATLEQ
jgi:hypothetical protein